MIYEKLCISCDVVKSSNEFWRQRNGLRSYCKSCCKKKWREYYHTNKDFKNKQNNKSKITAMKRTTRCQKYILEILSKNTCQDCCEDNIIVLEFDHVIGVKINEISNLINFGNLNNLKQEIEKCDIVCRNCHAKRTAKRNNNYKYRYSLNQ